MRPIAILAAAVLMVAVTGCVGGPGAGWGYDTKRSSPGQHIDLGGGRGIHLNEDTDLTATGVDIGRDSMFSNHARFATITLKHGRASWDGITSAIDRNNVARGMYYQHVNDVLDRIPPIIDRFVPLASQYLAMAGNVAMQRAVKPGLIQQLAAGVSGGHFDLPLVKGVFDAIDPTISPAVAAGTPAQSPTPIDMTPKVSLQDAEPVDETNTLALLK